MLFAKLAFNRRSIIIFFSRVNFWMTLMFWFFLLGSTYQKMSPVFHTLHSIDHFEAILAHPPKEWVLLPQISKNITRAIVTSEDGKFYQHHGIDLDEFRKVLIEKYLLHKKKIRGASTITQQLIKNFYLTKEKTLGRKIMEFYYAYELENVAKKEDILTVYLNIIEYGKDLYGIKSACQYYFKKKPKDINLKEAAFLAMLLPSPKKYSQSFKKKQLTPYAQRTIENILLRMKMGGWINEEQWQMALVTPLNFEIKNAEEGKNDRDSNEATEDESSDFEDL